MPEVTEKMLVQQLRELEADGLVRREIYPEVPPKVEYSLTDYGRTIRPVLNQMSKWGQRQIVRTGETHDGREEGVELVPDGSAHPCRNPKRTGRHTARPSECG